MVVVLVLIVCDGATLGTGVGREGSVIYLPHHESRTGIHHMSDMSSPPGSHVLLGASRTWSACSCIQDLTGLWRPALACNSAECSTSCTFYH